MFVTPVKRSKKQKSGWQLVGRGEPTAVPKEDGRTVRQLAYKEIERMSSRDAAWHMHNNAEHWKQAFDEEERRRQSKTHVATTRTRLQWQGHATESEDAQAELAAETFSEKFPQFERTLSNAQAMCRYMQEQDLAGTELSSYITAFRALREQGVLTLVKPEGADEYLQKHPELRGDPDRVPPLIEKRQQVAAATTAHFEQAASATAASGSTKVVDYEPEQRGPLYANTTKASFRNLLKNLSADEYLEKMQDPQFRASVDKVEK